MRRNTIRPIFLVILLSLSACGGFRAFPEAPFESTGQLESTKFAFLPETYKKYYEASGTEKLNLRNQIINAQVRAYDIRFQEYEQSLFELGIGLGVGTDWATLALAGLTATVGGTSTKAAFGAVTAGITGAKGAVDKHLFMEKTLPVIMTEIANQRSAVLLQLRAGLTETDVNKYSLDHGLSDLQRYARAGSIASALTTIAANSGSQLNANIEALNQLTTFSYRKDAAGEKLRAFWKPNGSVDANNASRIKQAMANLGLATGPGRLANFVNGAEFASLRLEVVKVLGL